MNGVVLFVALAGPAVDYSWRTTPDRQQEYTIQIEPEILRPLSTGEQIHSDVPAEAGQIQRLCIRIGMTPTAHTAAGEQAFRQLLVSAGRVASADRALAAADTQTTILWPARSNPEQTYGVTCGWQPDLEGQQAYYVQIDPTVLRTLSAGDEIHATVDPAAGRVSRFVVTSGNKQLPQVAATTTANSQPALTPPALTPSTTTLPGLGNRGRFNNGATSPSSFGTPPASGGAAKTVEYGPAAAAETSPARSSWGGTAGDYTRPAAGAQFSSSVTPLPGAGGAYNQREVAQLEPPRSGYSEPAGRATGGYSPPAWENQVADNRGFGQQPAANAGSFDRSRPLPPQNDMAPAANYGQQPAYGQQPNYQQQQPGNPAPTMRYSPAVADNRVASLPNNAAVMPQTTMQQTAMLPSPLAQPGAGDKPWGPLLFVTFALFFSIGGNLYLAYTALEFHNRYRSAIDRLRSAARSV